MGSDEVTPRARLRSKWGHHRECFERLETFVLSGLLLQVIRLSSMVFPLGGTRGTFTGMVFGSVFCTLGQVLYNEMGVQRLKYISRSYPTPSQPPTPSTVSEPSVPKKPLLDRVIHVIGINKLSDEEYLAQMREKRAAYLLRIEKLEAQLEEDMSSKNS
jgi:hypothetical protein